MFYDWEKHKYPRDLLGITEKQFRTAKAEPGKTITLNPGHRVVDTTIYTDGASWYKKIPHKFKPMQGTQKDDCQWI